MATKICASPSMACWRWQRARSPLRFPPRPGNRRSPSSSSCRPAPAAAPTRWRACPGRHHQEQPDEAADDRRQQVGRRRRGRLPRDQGREGRSQQAHHHAVEPVHDAARDRRAVQLAGPDAGRDARARPVRAVGQRRDAVQDGEGLSRRGQGRRPQQVQDGRHGVEAGRPDHHGRDREGHRHQVHLRAVQGRRRRRGAARRQAHRLDRQQPDRGGRAVARGRAAAAVRVRRRADAVQGEGDRHDVLERHPAAASRPASPSTT